MMATINIERVDIRDIDSLAELENKDKSFYDEFVDAIISPQHSWDSEKFNQVLKMTNSRGFVARQSCGLNQGDIIGFVFCVIDQKDNYVTIINIAGDDVTKELLINHIIDLCKKNKTPRNILFFIRETDSGNLLIMKRLSKTKPKLVKNYYKNMDAILYKIILNKEMEK